MMDNRKNIAVLFGGRSLEHEVSVVTAIQAMKAMDSFKYNIIPVYIDKRGKWYTTPLFMEKESFHRLEETIAKAKEVTLLPDPSVQGLTVKNSRLGSKIIKIDVFFLSFHGQFGEDGCIQGLLEMANCAYTSSNVLSCSLAMHKHHCKSFLRSHGIPVLPSIIACRDEAIEDLAVLRKKILSFCDFPIFVKPCHLGSSIGVSKALSERGLSAALAQVFKYDSKAIIEPFIQDLMEINIAVLDGEPPIASVVEIPVASEHTLTYEDKYCRAGSKKSGNSDDGMASLVRSVDPKDLSEELKKLLIKHAIEIFKLLDCSGTIRIDFMLDTSKEELYFNELNTLPGSFAYYLWEKTPPQMLYTEIIDRMIEKAEKKKVKRNALQTSFSDRAILI